jgi:hypothetical protein
MYTTACLPQELRLILFSSFESSGREEIPVTTITASVLPKFDVSQTTATLCIIGLIFTWFAVLGCLVAAVFVIKIPGVHFLRSIPPSTSVSEVLCSLPPSTPVPEVLSLIINILVALVTDCLGFIHGTSLRWALYRENRLYFNTNIRLFTSARRSAPNRWPSNVLCIASLILCYAATSQLFIRGPVAGVINRMAIAALGFGLMGQAAVASWCLFSTLKETPTWSSNPLNNTLAWLSVANSGYVQGRCMMSVHQQTLPIQQSRPQKKQRSPFGIRHALKYVLIFVWSLAILALLWAVAILLVSRHSGRFNHWYVTSFWYVSLRENGANDVSLFMNPPGNSYPKEIGSTVQIFCAILFTCAIQGAQTMGLHCVELLVNITRDEKAWRAATLPRDVPKGGSKAKGAQLETLALKSAASSWENALLFSLKALLHWLLGQSLQPSFQILGFQFDMLYMRLFVFGIAAIILALFATYLALQTARGPQPATYGHLQTLANLVDDWRTGTEGCLWWGDKGLNTDGTRHAGTSADLNSLGKIQMDAEYEGMRE